MKKYLFLDRDGTLIEEPEDFQIDHVSKFSLVPGVIPFLLTMKNLGYHFVMVTNQDGLGSQQYPQESFESMQTLLMGILSSQGIFFEEVLVCPHFAEEKCSCRKPKVGLVLPYLRDLKWDRKRSYVIGDRLSDVELACEMGISAFQLGAQKESGETLDYPLIQKCILERDRKISLSRETLETKIYLSLDLDGSGEYQISTGLSFFDHMLEQLSRHGGIDLSIEAKGDLHVDDHHLVEDVGILLGQALKSALGDKRGIERYSFILPMDESLCSGSMDLSGRPYCKIDCKIEREKVGDISSEMISHFFQSLCSRASLTFHAQVSGDNDHHKVESLFKCFARLLRSALRRDLSCEQMLPSTKGVL